MLMNTNAFVARLRKPIYILTMAQPIENARNMSVHDPRRIGAMKRAHKARTEIRAIAEEYVKSLQERDEALKQLTQLSQD